jgi:hypothetical protein
MVEQAGADTWAVVPASADLDSSSDLDDPHHVLRFELGKGVEQLPPHRPNRTA